MIYSISVYLSIHNADKLEIIYSSKNFHCQPGELILIRTVGIPDVLFLWVLDSKLWNALQKNKTSNIKFSCLLNRELMIQNMGRRVFKMVRWRFAICSLHTTLTPLCRFVEGNGSLLLACTILISMPRHLWVHFELRVFDSAQYYYTVATHVGCTTWAALQGNFLHFYIITSPQTFTIFYYCILVLKLKSQVPIVVRFIQLV